MKLVLIKIYVIFFILFFSFLFSYPNFFGENPSIIINNYSDFKNDHDYLSLKKKFLNNNISFFSIKLENKSDLIIRFNSIEDQFSGYDFLKKNGFNNVSLNILASDKIYFFQKFGINPMKVGLDLRGGVYLSVKINFFNNLRSSLELDILNFVDFLKNKKFNYRFIKIRKNNTVILKFFNKNEFNSNILYYVNSNFNLLFKSENFIIFSLKKKKVFEIRKQILDQTIFIFNKRINELGISDSVVKKVGKNNISIEIAGIQDINRAKKILGKAATLKFMLVDLDRNYDSYKVFYDEKGVDIFLKNDVLLTGDSIIYATSSFESGFNKPCINIKISDKDIKKFENFTRKNIGSLMAIVYKEVIINDKFEEIKEKIISIATIMSALGREFQITGLNLQESKDLALLLRSGSLPASVFIIEEKLIGPSIGEENIKNGLLSIIISLFFIFFFMYFRYSRLGILSNFVLLINIFLLLAIMSIIGVTLTLPGLAGIAITIGMSIDGNILIFERIKEELIKEKDLFFCIESGFKGAYSSIVDSNLTTLIIGLVLFILGNGPVKGFAVTLSIGILTSMYSSIFVTKTFIDYFYLKKFKII